VPLLIDEPRWPAHGRLWSHLVSDTSFAELHAFADALGLPPRSFEGDHYDVPAERYAAVLAAGARPVSMRELVVTLHASGLRRPKRKGERVLASTFLPDDGPAPGARLDLLASTLPSPVAPLRVDVLVFGRGGRSGRPSLLLAHDQRADEAWPLPGARLAETDDVEQAAARAVARHTDVRVEPSALRICGHAHTVGSEAVWTTYLTTTTDDSTHGARWLQTDAAPADVTGTPWWPLVGWLLDRRQPRWTG
jgi:ADP-ribose pyrophosphatase YjhB (NUDIX family)